MELNKHEKKVISIITNPSYDASSKTVLIHEYYENEHQKSISIFIIVLFAVVAAFVLFHNYNREIHKIEVEGGSIVAPMDVVP